MELEDEHNSVTEESIHTNSSNDTSELPTNNSINPPCYVTQLPINKINRFAMQISVMSEIELTIQERLNRVIDLYFSKSAKAISDYTLRKCKFNNDDKRQFKNTRLPATFRNSPAARDLYSKTRPLDNCEKLLQLGPYIIQQAKINNKNRKKDIKKQKFSAAHRTDTDLNKISSLSKNFQPSKYVEELAHFMCSNLKTSKALTNKASSIKSLFTTLANEHKRNVDIVYSAKTEKSASSVTLRSAHQLSKAAIKASSTPVFVADGTKINKAPNSEDR